MQQGTNEWLLWRRQGLGGSDIAAVIGVNPYSTANDVWLEKTGQTVGFAGNFATQRGSDLESRARARYELFALQDMPPAVIVHPKYDIVRVSFDGVSADRKKTLEIKCPGKASHAVAQRGLVPAHYIPQCQYGMAAIGADSCDFFSYYEGPEGVSHKLITVEADVKYQGMLIAKALEFWELVKSKTPPPLTDKDFKIITEDAEIELLCAKLLMTKDEMTKKEVDHTKAAIIELGGHPKIKCGDVQISTVMRNGKFSYHKITFSKSAGE